MIAANVQMSQQSKRYAGQAGIPRKKSRKIGYFWNSWFPGNLVETPENYDTYKYWSKII